MLKKTPQQQRSRGVVQSILQAAGQLLASRGLREVSTRNIADAAGVSIGSLYQYFDNKEEIAACLHEEHVRTSVQFATSILISAGADRVLGRYRLLLRELLAMHEHERILHLNFLELEAALPVFRAGGAIEMHTAVLSALLREEFPRLSPESSELHARVLMRSVHVMIHSAIAWRCDGRDRIVTEHFDAFVPAYDRALSAKSPPRSPM
jgi:AcrR family transcriptional regulator